ncbi:hypothetical protein BDV12DRAFT_195681 [Aspergillus spectabilis]
MPRCASLLEVLIVNRVSWVNSYRDERKIRIYTHRRFEVGADATEASTERPGRDGPRELANTLALSVPSGLLSSEVEARSGRVPEYCDDADEAPCAVSVADWLAAEDEVLYARSFECEFDGDGGRRAGSMGDARNRSEATVEVVAGKLLKFGFC